jgi:hypothetical protein
MFTTATVEHHADNLRLIKACDESDYDTVVSLITSKKAHVNYRDLKYSSHLSSTYVDNP